MYEYYGNVIKSLNKFNNSYYEILLESLKLVDKFMLLI